MKFEEYGRIQEYCPSCIFAFYVKNYYNGRIFLNFIKFSVLYSITYIKTIKRFLCYMQNSNKALFEYSSVMYIYTVSTCKLGSSHSVSFSHCLSLPPLLPRSRLRDFVTEKRWVTQL